MDHVVSILEAARRVEVFDHRDTMALEKTVALVVLDGSRWRVERFAVHFENSPLPVQTDQEVGFTVASATGWSETAHAVGQEQDADPI